MALIGLGVAGAALSPAVANAATLYYGKYRGLVTNVTDPSNLGRILANVPALGAVLLGWAMPSVPYAGAGIGFLMLPLVGAQVWIEFEGGDPNLPIWSGGFWGSGELPTLVSTQKIIKTLAGHTILLDDTAAGEHIQIVAAGGATITLDNNGITLGMGPTQMLISASGVSINGRALRTAAATAALNSLLLND
ncbi:MAG: phage baseplate assembly protein V [Deltaproteobacteria bacterium]|nr:phage baseplate assembly protein V [Deltaproteobacteria bacterium]